jgi:lipopolysaccharide/colanic/teichoic acid biosynthesis glycosyltransferase
MCSTVTFCSPEASHENVNGIITLSTIRETFSEGLHVDQSSARSVRGAFSNYQHKSGVVSRFPGVDVPAKWTGNRNRALLTRKEIVAKRALDLLLAGTALIILSPLLALICLAIKLEGRSPSILLQRQAFNGREFAVYNFTTTAWEGARIGQARRNDSRVTGVGRLLRATGLDELPQLFSVLGGQMSLVGPQPHAVDPKGEFSDPIARYATQHDLKPGIIGWAPREAAQVERWYIDNWSIWLDLRILLRTLVGEWV